MPTIKLITPSHVLSEQLDDEMVLLNIDTERYYCLDDVGTRMWQVLLAGKARPPPMLGHPPILLYGEETLAPGCSPWCAARIR